MADGSHAAILKIYLSYDYLASTLFCHKGRLNWRIKMCWLKGLGCHSSQWFLISHGGSFVNTTISPIAKAWGVPWPLNGATFLPRDELNTNVLIFHPFNVNRQIMLLKKNLTQFIVRIMIIHTNSTFDSDRYICIGSN